MVLVGGKYDWGQGSFALTNHQQIESRSWLKAKTKTNYLLCKGFEEKCKSE